MMAPTNANMYAKIHLYNSLRTEWFTVQFTIQLFLSDGELLTEASTYTIQPIPTHSYHNNSYLCTFFKYDYMIITTAFFIFS